MILNGLLVTFTVTLTYYGFEWPVGCADFVGSVLGQDPSASYAI
jgi:hypothetical protein